MNQPAGRVLRATVKVAGTVWPAGSTPPPDIAQRITNPKAWADGIGTVPEPVSTLEQYQRDRACGGIIRGPVPDGDDTIPITVGLHEEIFPAGGVLPAGETTAVNTTGNPEPVLADYPTAPPEADQPRRRTRRTRKETSDDGRSDDPGF